jgi:hypothetical protein
VTGQFEQSDTKVKTRLFRLRLEIQVKYNKCINPNKCCEQLNKS